MGRMPFLPEELSGPEEKSGTKLPANDVGPLIEQDRKITVGLHPLCVSRSDDRLRGRANDERLGQLSGGNEFSILELEAVVSDDRAFLGEALDMIGFLLQVTEGNEEGEVGILVAGRLEHAVEGTLHPLPEGIPPGPDHHASADLGIFSKFRRTDDLLVPLGKILPTLRGNRAFLAFAHEAKRVALRRRITQVSVGTARRNQLPSPSLRY